MIQRRFKARGGGSVLAALLVLFTTFCCLGFPALVGLLGAQVWDLWLFRQCVRRATPAPTDAPLVFSETRKEGV